MFDQKRSPEDDSQERKSHLHGRPYRAKAGYERCKSSGEVDSEFLTKHHNPVTGFHHGVFNLGTGLAYALAHLVRAVLNLGKGTTGGLRGIVHASSETCSFCL